MSTEKFTTNSSKSTQGVALKLAKKVLKQKPWEEAVILTLRGNLGAGKTTFLQGFAKGLGIKDKITSPTFVIMKRFSIQIHEIKNKKLKIKNTNKNSKSNNFKNFYHIDCYRLKSEKDLMRMGFKEIISNPKNIIAIEWPERVSKILPSKVLEIKIANPGGNKRKLAIK